MRQTARRLILAGLFLLAGNAALHAAPAPPIACDEAAFAQSVQLAGSGQTGPLQAFAESCTASSRRNEALRLSARLAYDQKRFDDTLRLIRLLPVKMRIPVDAVFEGLAQIAQGSSVSQGLALLQSIDPASLEPGQRVSRLTGLADGFQLTGDFPAALLTLNEAASLTTGEEQLRICQIAHSLVRDKLDEVDLTPLVARLGSTPVRLDVQTERARRALKGKDPTTAKGLLDEVLASAAPYAWRYEALQLRDQIEGNVWLQHAVGVILPLSGKYAAFGSAVQRGIELAQSERNPKARSTPFIFRDVGAEAEENARAVERLAREDRVMALIGPLSGGAALSAAESAQNEALPLIALAQRDGIPEIGNFVFRDALTNRNQVETLVRYATERQLAKRFAILAPNNRLGQEQAELFAQAVALHGGTIVARQSYEENATDFRTPVKLIKGEDPTIPDPTDKESRRHVRPLIPPPQPFDAIFIPDVGERVGMIAPYLAFYGLEGVLMLGTSGWNTPDLLENSSRYVEGAVIVDGFFAGSTTPRTQKFVERYTARYGEEPSILAAEGYDLARLLLALLDRSDIHNRTELRTALENLKPFPGITGELTFDTVGETKKSPFLLQIKNGSMVPVD